MSHGKNVNAEPDYMFPHLAIGDYGHAVGFVQYVLRRLGFYKGPVTEHFNQATEEALKRFQMSQREPITGVMDRSMWRVLNGVAVNRGVLQGGISPHYVNRFTPAQAGFH
ncbi:MAG: peptidoglycan-binding domain-containing protein [Firmicutes bacterium]|nr:peptidoglycan-binding domain-containing protein [Bacillota bacterium]